MKFPWPALAFAVLLAGGAVVRSQAQADAGIRPALADVAYGTAAAQRFDLYAPMRPHGAPTIFFVHGGGWAFGDKSTGLGAKARHWTEAGAFVVSVNYRMLPEADPQMQARDVASALAHAQTVVAQAGGDPDAFVLMGHSAGGHLVALLDASPALAREAGARAWRGSVLLDAGSVDVVATMQSTRGRLPLFRNAFGDDPAFWRSVSPIHQLAARGAPVLGVCASGRAESCDDNRAFLDKAAGFGTPTRLLPEPLNHMRINRDLGEDNAYTREVDAFLHSVGGLPPPHAHP